MRLHPPTFLVRLIVNLNRKTLIWMAIKKGYRTLAFVSSDSSQTGSLTTSSAIVSTRYGARSPLLPCRPLGARSEVALARLGGCYCYCCCFDVLKLNKYLIIVALASLRAEQAVSEYRRRGFYIYNYRGSGLYFFS